jgi:hypothetical protein
MAARKKAAQTAKRTDSIVNGVKDEVLEQDLATALYKQAVEVGNVIAAKFLLTNLYPERWALTPLPGRRGAGTQDPQGDGEPTAEQEDNLPFRLRLKTGT